MRRHGTDWLMVALFVVLLLSGAVMVLGFGMAAWLTVHPR